MPAQTMYEPDEIKARVGCGFAGTAARLAEVIERTGRVDERLEAGRKSRRCDNRVEWFARAVGENRVGWRQPLERRLYPHSPTLESVHESHVDQRSASRGVGGEVASRHAVACEISEHEPRCGPSESIRHRRRQQAQ